MIELLYMTYLMNDDIVAHLWRKKRQLVIEIEVAFLRTATPSAFLISDGDPTNLDPMPRAIMLHEMINAPRDERSCRFLVGKIQSTTPSAIE